MYMFCKPYFILDSLKNVQASGPIPESKPRSLAGPPPKRKSDHSADGLFQWLDSSRAFYSNDWIGHPETGI